MPIPRTWHWLQPFATTLDRDRARSVPNQLGTTGWSFRYRTSSVSLRSRCPSIDLASGLIAIQYLHFIWYRSGPSTETVKIPNWSSPGTEMDWSRDTEHVLFGTEMVSYRTGLVPNAQVFITCILKWRLQYTPNTTAYMVHLRFLGLFLYLSSICAGI